MIHKAGVESSKSSHADQSIRFHIWPNEDVTSQPVRAWKAGRAVHLSPSSDCAMFIMDVASKYRNVFPVVAKASHKRSQSNFRDIAVLTITTSVSTVFSIICSHHLELHARRVFAFSCVQLASSSISHGVDDNTFSPCVIITRPWNTSCTTCSLIDRRVRICCNTYVKTPANYLEHYSFFRRTSVYLYLFFVKCQLLDFPLCKFKILYQLESPRHWTDYGYIPWSLRCSR